MVGERHHDSPVQRGLDEALACQDMLARAPVEPSSLSRMVAACRRVFRMFVGGAMVALGAAAVPIAAAQPVECDWASYPDFCIPAYPPDLDCGQIGAGWFTVNSPDPHFLDGDFDGIGCEA